MKQNIHDLLLKSFDLTLSEMDQKILDTALSNDPALQLEKEQLILMRRTLLHSPASSFQPNFSLRVMARMRSLKSKNNQADPFFESLQSLFKPVMACSFLLLIGIITYNIVSNKYVAMAGLMPSEEITLQEAFTPSFTPLQEY